jgi:DNA-binding LytR/AlgR family response regulator
MKISLEIKPNSEEEIVIRVPSVTENTLALQDAITKLVNNPGEISLGDKDNETFVAVRELLFFETLDGLVFAHTATVCLECHKKLYELEEELPPYFVRSSKNGIVNVMKIRSIQRSITGVGEISFLASAKKTNLSRMYYQNVRDKIQEMRLK